MNNFIFLYAGEFTVSPFELDCQGSMLGEAALIHINRSDESKGDSAGEKSA
jgi:hypothetical protein